MHRRLPCTLGAVCLHAHSPSELPLELPWPSRTLARRNIETGTLHGSGCFQWCCRCRRRHRCCTRAADATANVELPMPLSALLCCCHYCDDACWPSLFSATLADMVCGRACMVAALAGAVRRLASPGLCLPESRGVFRSRLGRKGSTTCTPGHHMSRVKDCVPAVLPQSLMMKGHVQTGCPWASLA